MENSSNNREVLLSVRNLDVVFGSGKSAFKAVSDVTRDADEVRPDRDGFRCHVPDFIR